MASSSSASSCRSNSAIGRCAPTMMCSSATRAASTLGSRCDTVLRLSGKMMEVKLVCRSCRASNTPRVAVITWDTWWPRSSLRIPPWKVSRHITGFSLNYHIYQISCMYHTHDNVYHVCITLMTMYIMYVSHSWQCSCAWQTDNIHPKLVPYPR